MKKRIVCILLALVLCVGLMPAGALTASAASSLTTSEEAIAILKEMEGLSLKAYEDGTLADGTKRYSIGYGTQASGPDDTITAEEADKALRAHLVGVDNAINSFAAKHEKTFSQNQHDALSLFSYNCGTAWMNNPSSDFRNSVLQNHKGNDFLYSICTWANTKRRLTEADLYLNGSYDNAHPANYTYTKLDANGGSVVPSVYGYDSQTPLALTVTASTTGTDRFLGWYTAKEGGSLVTALDENTAGKTLYAHWQAKDAESVEVSYTIYGKQVTSLKVYEHYDGAKQIGTVGAEDKLQIVAEYVNADNVKWAKLKDGGWVSLGKVSAPNTVLVNIEVTVTNSYVNVRKSAGATPDIPIVGKLSYGDKITITQVTTVNTALWGRFSGGWVALSYTNYAEVLKNPPSSGEGSEGGSDTPDTVIATGTVVVSNVLNVRKGAGTNYALVGTLKNGTKVSIYQITEVGNHKWGRIDAGWICLDYVTLDAEPSTPPAEGETPEEETVIATGAVAHTYVNVRSGPGTNYTRLGDLKQGQKLKFYQFETVNNVKWGRFDTGKWVCMTYVQLDAAVDVPSGPAASSITGTAKTDLIVYNDKAELVDTIKSGTTFNVSDFGVMTDGEDVFVMAETPKGWVKAELVNFTMTPTKLYVKAENGLNVRPSAGDSATVLEVLKKDDQVTASEMVIIADAVWVKVSYGENKTGWVNAEFLTETAPVKPDEGGSGEGGTDTPAAPEGLYTGVISGSDNVNVRSTAGVEYNNKVGTIARGTQVTVYEETLVGTAPWVRIGEGRWVAKQYVTKTETGSGSGSGSTGGSTGSGNTTPYATGIVNSNTNLKVRSGPGMTYPILDSLPRGTEVKIYEQEVVKGMIWGRIGEGRWVCLSYVITTSTGGSDSGSGTGVMGTVVNTYGGLNVRSAPGTGNALVGKLMPNSRIEIFEQRKYGSSMWGRTAQGWVCMDYVLLDSELPEGGLPGTDIPGSGDSSGVTPGLPTTPTTPVNAKGIEATVANVDVEVAFRKEADLNSEVLFNALKGTTIYIEEVKAVGEEEWVKYSGGWARKQYIEITIPADYTVDSEDGLNLRKEASTSSEAIKVLENGAKVVAEEVKFMADGAWVKTTAGEDTGWVMASYLKNGYTAPAPEEKPDEGGETGGTDTTPDPTPDSGVVTPGTGATMNMGSTTTTANNAQGYLYTGKVWGTNSLKVRQSASTNANVITTLKNGAAMVIYETCISEYMAWGRCDAGWICLVYVDLMPYNSSAIDARVVQNFNGATVHDSVGGTQVGSYIKGAVIDIYRIVGNWAETPYGWVSTYDLLG